MESKQEFKAGDRVIVKDGIKYSNCKHGGYETGNKGTFQFSCGVKDCYVLFDHYQEGDFLVELDEIRVVSKLEKALL